MQRLRNRGNKGDGPPMLSLEFMIQNHADIISCVCMVIFMLLIPQVSPREVAVLAVERGDDNVLSSPCR